LNFQGAVRWADYAGSGTIWSYKGGLDAQVTRSLRLRGTYSRDVRAANIGERFDRTGGFANINDRGLTPAATYGITFVSGGNPALKPEEADTYTVGFVYRPEWLPGFDVSVDWLSVSLTDAIESLTSQQIVDACYVNGDADQCTRITRDAGTIASRSSTSSSRISPRRRSAAWTWRSVTCGPSRCLAATRGSGSAPS
jgi:iron complex outermembrane receptor protein